MRRRLAFALAAIVILVAPACDSRSDEDAAQPDTTVAPTTVAPTTTTTAAPTTTTTSAPTTTTTAPPPQPVEAPAAPAPQANQRTPLGNVVADSGFRPENHGFVFQNYGSVLSNGSQPTNLTVDDLRSMFGDAVCQSTANGTCTLSPGAKAWLDQTNQQMTAGHCYGFAVASSLLWQDKLAEQDYGGTATPGLRITDNQSLQRRIAVDWASQLVDSVRSKIVTGTPNDVLNRLMTELRPGPAELYTVAFWKPDGAGGHAVTPFAIEDRGGGQFSLLIYDNNWPGETRDIKFDTNTNTWAYAAALNPDQPHELYEGTADTKSLALYPTFPGLGPQPCPFCETRTVGGGVTLSDAAASHAEEVGDTLKASAVSTQEIFLYGSHVEHPDLLVTDDAGRRLGFVDGKLVQEIPGGRVAFTLATENWAMKLAPHLIVPAEKRYRITLDASALTKQRTETLGVIGPGFNMSIPDLRLRRGDRDTLILGANGESITYSTSRPRTPRLKIGISEATGAYEFELGGLALRGSALKVRLPVAEGSLSFANVGTSLLSRVKLRMTRYTTSGVDVFANDSIRLIGDAKATVYYGSPETLDEIPVSVRRGGRTRKTTLSNEGS
jgi:hypothetical protein